MTLLLGVLGLIACRSPEEARPPGPENSQEDDRPADWWKGESGWCGAPLTAEHLDQAIALGRDHLVHNQLPEGNFVYEYDWRTERTTRGDSEVRQAGAFWGLSLVHLERPTDETRAALQKAVHFWRSHEVKHEDGRRWLHYPTSRSGHLGTLSLVALAHVELLRSGDPAFDAAALKAALDGYLAQMIWLQRDDGLFHVDFRLEDGQGYGEPSPYADGEALLAMARIARHLGRDDLWPRVELSAIAGWTFNVEKALKADPDSDTTKGYYQWGSMAWHELVQSGRPRSAMWGDRLIDLAVWMIDTHATLKRSRNTAYAYEGIVPAYAVAREREDPRAEKLGCVVQLGLRKLASWQIGHPLANAYVAVAPANDPRALGGVQNKDDESLLRIDVVQHQTHANLLARRLWAEPPPATLTER